MPGESTNRSVPADQHPEQGAEDAGLPGPGRTSGLRDGEDRYSVIEDRDQGVIGKSE